MRLASFQLNRSTEEILQKIAYTLEEYIGEQVSTDEPALEGGAFNGRGEHGTTTTTATKIVYGNKPLTKSNHSEANQPLLADMRKGQIFRFLKNKERQLWSAPRQRPRLKIDYSQCDD